MSAFVDRWEDVGARLGDGEARARRQLGRAGESRRVSAFAAPAEHHVPSDVNGRTGKPSDCRARGEQFTDCPRLDSAAPLF